MIERFLPSKKQLTPFANQTAIIHGGDYNPDQWLPMVPDILEQDASIMQASGINSSTVGIFAWTSLEPEEGKFTFDWLDRVMDVQARIGNRVILATPSGAMPAWLAAKYPDARRIDRRGFRAHYGGRHNHCWSSPSYHQRVQIINNHLAQRYKNHPALAMWHVSNELSGDCFCDLCRKSWMHWLEQRYGTLTQMNNAHWAYFWSHQATDWQHAEPTDDVMDGLVLDWHRFTNQQLIDWYTFEAGALKAVTPNVPVTTNFMTTSFGLDYNAISRAVDVVADDQYPGYDPEQPNLIKYAAFWSMKQDLYRCFKPDRTFMLMESCPGAPQWRAPQRVKRPNVHRLEMLQAIAHGADGTCYFQFRAGRGSMEKLHGAVVEHWDTERHTHTRRHRELRALSDCYAKLVPVLGTSVKPEVAIIYDWQSKWGQRLSYGTGVKMPAWDGHELNYFDEVATEHYINFWNRGIPVDVIPDDRELSRYKLVVLPMHWIVTPEFARKIANYVSDGGTLVATWDTAMADEHNRMLLGGWPGEGLGNLFGMWIEEVDRLKTGTPRAIRGLPGRGGHVAAIVQLERADVIATYAEDFYEGTAAVTVNAFGKGRAYFVGTRLDATALSSLYTSIIEKNAIASIMSEPLPEGVTAQIRGAGDEAFIFLLNFTMREQIVSVRNLRLRNIETGEVANAKVTLAPLAAECFIVVDDSGV
jgi:beta-galactosidase